MNFLIFNIEMSRSVIIHMYDFIPIVFTVTLRTKTYEKQQKGNGDKWENMKHVVQKAKNRFLKHTKYT